MWLDTQLEMHMIKAFKEMSLCLCAHGGREIGMCYSVFHVLFSLFFFFLSGLSRQHALAFLLRRSPFSSPTGQAGCIHQASCLFMAAAPVEPEPQ